MKKKILAMLLACSMLSTAMAGCGSSQASSEVSSERNSTSSASASESSSNSDAPLELEMALKLYHEVPDMNNEYWTEWQTKYNVKLNIQWTPYMDYQEQINLRLASGDLPEIFTVQNFSTVQIRDAVRAGMIWDLTDTLGDFSEYPNLKSIHDLGVYPQSCMMDGRIWGVPRVVSPINAATVIRKDLFDALDLPLPTTTQELADGIKQILESPITNPDGDMIGFVGNGVNPNLLQILPDADLTFKAAFGCYNLTYDDDGGLIYPELTPQYADMVEYFRDLYAAGCLPKEYATFKTAQAEESFKLGKVVAYGRSIRQAGNFRSDLQNNVPGAESFVLGPMTGPNGDVGVYLANMVTEVFCISVDVPEEKVLKMLDYFDSTATEEATNLAKWGVIGVHSEEDPNNEGVYNLTELGQEQINTNSGLAGCLALDLYVKVWNPVTPHDYNEKMYEQVKDFYDVGQYNPFDTLVSETWTQAFPDFVTGYSTAITEAIMGVISMDEFREYQAEIREREDVKQAFQEFAAAYEENR